MRNTRRAAVVLGVVMILVAGLIGPTTAEFTSWTDFGAGWANAGFTHNSPIAAPMNGNGNHAGQVAISSSTELDPRRIRIRVVSDDPNPVEVEVWYLWLGCKRWDGGYFGRDISDEIPTLTPPATFMIYDRREQGRVESCHINADFSTTLFDDGLHHYKVKLQARYNR